MPDARSLLPSHVVEDDVLTDYLAAELPLVGVARRHDLTLDQLLDFLESPATRARLDRIARANAQRAHDIAADAHASAIASLANVAATADPAEQRRAAVALLKRLAIPPVGPVSNRPNPSRSSPTGAAAFLAPPHRATLPPPRRARGLPWQSSNGSSPSTGSRASPSPSSFSPSPP
ncbi:MAG: hypothetical protein R3B57_01475 [Phycisphaerales bacterium]